MFCCFLTFATSLLPCYLFQSSTRFDHSDSEECVNITLSVFIDLTYSSPPFFPGSENGGGAVYVSNYAASAYITHVTFARCRTLGDFLSGGACYMASHNSVLSYFCSTNCSSENSGHFLYVPYATWGGETDETLSSGTVCLAGWSSQTRRTRGAMYVDSTSLPNCSRVNFSRGVVQGDGAAFTASNRGTRRVSLAFLTVANNSGNSVIYTEWYVGPAIVFGTFWGNAVAGAVLSAHQEGMAVTQCLFIANTGAIAALAIPDWGALFVFNGCAFSGPLPTGSVTFTGANAHHTLAPTHTHSGYNTFWCGLTATPARTRTPDATATRPRTATRSPTATESRTPTETESRSPTPTESRSPTPTESRSPTPTESRTPTATESRSPTETESQSPTQTPRASHAVPEQKTSHVAAAAGSAGGVAVVVALVLAAVCFRTAKNATLLSEQGLTDDLDGTVPSYTDGPTELTHELTFVFKNERLEGIEALKRGDMDELL
jgi:hypothetical protein